MSAHFFQFVNLIALVGWIMLIGFPTWRNTPKGILNGVIAMLCFFYYSTVMAWWWEGPRGGFDSLANVMLLFTSERAVLAGWVHYLAFDLFVGLWITLDAQKISLKRGILIPVQLLTFMFGPIGLVLYMIIRRLKTKEHLSGL
jgi:hypothetical protein